MIWARTDAGRVEMHTRALVKERAQRNLLFVIDGVKSEAMLLAGLAGISGADFQTLQALGLIAPVSTSGARAAPAASAAPGRPAPGPAPALGPATAAPDPPTATLAAASALADSLPTAFDSAQFTEALTRLISHELGLRGFVLTLAAQKADSVETLRGVAQRALEQIRERNGESAAEAARRTLHRG
ncbi:MAG: hypothetical protein ABIP61_11720 [Burkholderiaceae bacterium]